MSVFVEFTDFEAEVIENWLTEALNGAGASVRARAVERAARKIWIARTTKALRPAVEESQS